MGNRCSSCVSHFLLLDKHHCHSHASSWWLYCHECTHWSEHLRCKFFYPTWRNCLHACRGTKSHLLGKLHTFSNSARCFSFVCVLSLHIKQ
ncbi:hypothetical protein CsSME_00049526 [Camellia sinensis var. sinensis]